MLERRVLNGGVTALVSTNLETEGFTIAFTERVGGTSGPPFDGLNLSAATGDDARTVRANREAACRALGIETFAVGQQVHGASVAFVGANGLGDAGSDGAGAIPGVDGLVTDAPGVAVAVMVADCVPVALASAAEGRVAVVHAGWRGIAAGVVQAAVAAFRDPAEVRGAIGPAVGIDHYEVGHDVAGELARATGGLAVSGHGAGRPRVDLAGTVRRLLETAGLSRIERADLCTACEPSRFYSHRRDGPRTGRQGLIAVRR